MAEVVCLLCDSLVKRSALESHINTRHLQVLPYSCPSCDFRAATADFVKSHQVKHGHSGKVGEETNLILLFNFISSSFDAAQKVGLAKVLAVLDQIAGESDPAKPQQPSVDISTDRTVFNLHSDPKLPQIQRGSDVNPVVSVKIAEQLRGKENRKKSKLVVISKYHSAESTAMDSTRKRPLSTSNCAETVDVTNELIKVKRRRIDSTANQSEAVQAYQHWTANEEKAKLAGLEAKSRQNRRRDDNQSSLADLQSHSNTLGMTKLFCRQCGKIYKYPKALESHKWSAHSTQPFAK